MTELRAPELAEPAADVTVPAGASATLSCRALATRAAASWRKTAPETHALRHGGRFAIAFTPDGLASLTIHSVRAADAGVYCCLVSNELGGVQTSARLAVGSGAGGAGGSEGEWQREQFARRYAPEEEVGRGRTARVVAARDTGTGQRVALKQVAGGRGADAVREYRILSSGAHGGVVRALALFAEVPRAGAHTLVLELVGGGALLDWAAAHPDLYTQRTVATHARHLFSALDWLHSNNVAHLDVRVRMLFRANEFNLNLQQIIYLVSFNIFAAGKHSR